MHGKVEGNKSAEDPLPIVRVLYPAPHFEGKAWYCDTGAKDIKLKDYSGSYLVLFFYPMDFTFVCPTEILEFSNHYEAFKAAGCEVLGCSGDTLLVHREYTSKPRSRGGLGPIKIPLLADPTHKVTKAYGAYIYKGPHAGVAYRATFIIDENGIIRHKSINDLPVGRNVGEIVRLVKALKHAKENNVRCPVNWKEGDKHLPVCEIKPIESS